MEITKDTVIAIVGLDYVALPLAGVKSIDLSDQKIID